MFLSQMPPFEPGARTIKTGIFEERRTLVLQVIHEATVALDVGADDVNYLTFKTFYCHNGTPL
ncbi:MAG: hypothetical protein H8E17_05925 [Deltaproteobacteria bacterium]|nr:hypothetical protein [Deltaproteobacteria bacterium]